MFGWLAVLDPKVWIAFAVAVVLSAGAAAGAVFFWHLGKAEEIKFAAKLEGYAEGAADTQREFKRGQQVAKKHVAKKKRTKAHFKGITIKLEKLIDDKPYVYRVDCDLTPERLRLINEALSGPRAGDGADGAVRAPEPASGAEPEGVRPADDRERAESARLREQNREPPGVDPRD